MKIKDFINPIDEEVIDTNDDIIASIIAQDGPERDAELKEDYGKEENPAVIIETSISALNSLKLYYELQEEMTDEVTTRLLRTMGQDLHVKKTSRGEQSTLVGWLKQ
ncbi:hypothetical protein GcC1_152017 [Golovinomyces cichoracearum]|uniref:Uncharacterized protein n=1 Tax=Golovinomyces cichoracearum TaxID=62708 RepID=A0A420HWN1_9PEZI|nr:hypothetical protein GcC1_152017 [Golovinomyces cichoracearum]